MCLNTSNHMFEIIRPGMPMKEADAEARRYNAGLLVDAGVLDDAKIYPQSLQKQLRKSKISC